LPAQHKFARIERERRFLLDGFPSNANVIRVSRITDRYIDGTALRLRQLSDDIGSVVFKLTQKVPSPDAGAQQGFITTMYLREHEFRALAQLSGAQLNKIRYSVPPFGIDVFEDRLEGLVMAEAEFESALDADALTLPSFILREVSTDDRFTGGQLARASRQQIQVWLSEYGIKLR
jgi:CYTH domain-containing protein